MPETQTAEPRTYPALRDLLIGLRAPGRDLHFFKDRCGPLADELEALLQAQAREAWRPLTQQNVPVMEAVLVFGGEVTYPVVASWSGMADEPWTLDALEDCGQEIDWPTHWMPLPQPPSPEGAL